MSFSRSQNLSILVNMSHESLPQTIVPPNTPMPAHHDLLSSAQAVRMSTTQTVNLINEDDFGCYAPYLGIREEQSNEMFDDPTEPHPIFPFVRNRTLLPPHQYSPHFADQLPLGFINEEWERVWNANESKINAYLLHVQTARNEVFVPWTNEYDYQGAGHRLTIDRKCSLDRLPKFTHGTTIAFRNCNGRNYRYIIDHCVHQDDVYAYLKVYCFDSGQHRYNVCSYRPPLILVIPKSHNDVRFHPHLNPRRQQSPGTLYTKTEQEIIDKVLHGYRANRSRSLWERLFRW